MYITEIYYYFIQTDKYITAIYYYFIQKDKYITEIYYYFIQKDKYITEIYYYFINKNVIKSYLCLSLELYFRSRNCCEFRDFKARKLKML